MLDLKLDSSRDLAIETFDVAGVAGADEVAQRIGTRLRLFRGEWFLDTTAGTPWYDTVLVQDPDPAAIEAAIKDAIRAVEEVEEILAFDMDFDRGKRRIDVSFTARTTVGIIRFEEVL